MKTAEIQVKINIAKQEMQYWQSIMTSRSCRDCEQFPSGVCKLAGGIVPPPEVQKTGCPEWSWDEIPF